MISDENLHSLPKSLCLCVCEVFQYVTPDQNNSALSHETQQKLVLQKPLTILGSTKNTLKNAKKRKSKFNLQISQKLHSPQPQPPGQTATSLETSPRHEPALGEVAGCFLGKHGTKMVYI